MFSWNVFDPEIVPTCVNFSGEVLVRVPADLDAISVVSGRFGRLDAFRLPEAGGIVVVVVIVVAIADPSRRAGPDAQEAQEEESRPHFTLSRVKEPTDDGLCSSTCRTGHTGRWWRRREEAATPTHTRTPRERPPFIPPRHQCKSDLPPC